VKAAAQGNADAQNRLGECCYYGIGVKLDYNQAGVFWEQAASRGLKQAEDNLRQLRRDARGNFSST
jgi:TPR repeat protein